MKSIWGEGCAQIKTQMEIHASTIPNGTKQWMTSAWVLQTARASCSEKKTFCFHEVTGTSREEKEIGSDNLYLLIFCFFILCCSF